MSWSVYGKEFAADDGSLRDIYVQDTTIGDWRSAWAWLIASGMPLHYSVDGASRELPADPQEPLDIRSKAAPLLVIELDEIKVNCHFFGVDTIEFDIDPKQVNSEETMEAVFSFLLRMSNALNKRVDLTGEGEPEKPIFVAQPNSDSVTYVM